MRTDSELAKLLGRTDRGLPMQFEIPTHPGKKLGLRALTEREVERAHAAAIRRCREDGFFSGSAEESAASLAQVLDTKKGRDAVGKESGTVGALAVIATSELGYALQCEELALSLCDPNPKDMHPLVKDSDELRDVLEREEVEWLSAKLEQWMRDRAPLRIHLSRAEIKELAAAAKKGQKPTVQWNCCAYSTLLDCATIFSETLATCGSETSSSSTPDTPAPSP